MVWSSDKRTAYNRQKRQERKHRAIIILGGECVLCQLQYDWHNRSNMFDFEFDHVPGYTKNTKICAIWNTDVVTLMAELAKCQLVCTECHIELTRARRLHTYNPILKGIIAEEEVPF